MAKNRFEQVDELQPDAINLTLIQKRVRDAVLGAIQLANSKKIPIVVIDRDNIWKGEWGDLWRYQEEDE